VKYIRAKTAGRLPIIAAGGVFTTDDVLEKLDAGASLVQIYTGLIYKGPSIVGNMVRELQDSAPWPKCKIDSWEANQV
jgi:dihydroorotate dehydrogenase